MMEANQITALHICPNKPPELVLVEPTEPVFRGILGSSVEEIFPYFEEVMLLCSASAKVERKPPNRALYDENGNLFDIVAGDFLLVGAPLTEPGFISLTPEQITRYQALYQTPDQFTATLKGYKVVPTGSKA